MRLFVGLDHTPSPAVEALLEELRQLPQGDTGLRIVSPANLHVTLQFLGAASAEQAQRIQPALEAALADASAFELPLRGIGCFSRALWLGIDDDGRLTALAERLAEPLAELGFEREARPFHPHLTVARLSRQARIPLSTLLERHQGTDWGRLRVDAVHLYQSRTDPRGAQYSIRGTVPLRSPGTGDAPTSAGSASRGQCGR